MRGVTLREVCDTEVLKERIPALFVVTLDGYLNVLHLSVIVILLSFALVDKKKIQANCGCGATNTVRSVQTEWLTDGSTTIG